jgi:protein-disulfide isomerase
MTRLPPVAVALLIAGRIAAQEPASQLVVAGVEPDAGGRSITITGQRFGAQPFVTLDLIPLDVQSSGDTRIVALAPIDRIPPGTYLLTVSRGASAGESASLPVTLGGAEPRAPGASRGLEEQPGPRAAAAGAVTSSLLAPAPGDPVARVGDRVFTVAEIDREWQRTDPGGYLGVLRRAHDMRRQVADTLVADELIAREAARRGVTKEALLDQEIPRRMVGLPDSAVRALYESLGDGTRGATLDQMRPALRAWLSRHTEPEIARMNFVEELMRVSTRAELLLEPPRVAVERAAQDVTLGPEGAAVEVVAFGDLRNARYAAFARTFGRVRETYGNRVRVVFKNLPLLAPDSVAAAEAAQCANAQGRFWPYHDALLSQTGTFTPTRLKALAGDVGLARDPFDACLDTGRFRAVIARALEEARRYDIQTSPSFLVNGRLAPDPPPFLPPYEFFTRLIDEELSRRAKRPPPKPR